MIHPLSLRPLSRHSAGRSSALMTSRFLTIEITSAGPRRKRLAIKETHGPSAMRPCSSSSKPAAPRRRSTNIMTTSGKLIRNKKISMLLCLVPSPLTSYACPSFLYALIKARLWPPSTRRLKHLNHMCHIPIPAQVSRYLFVCKKKDRIPAVHSIR